MGSLNQNSDKMSGRDAATNQLQAQKLRKQVILSEGVDRLTTGHGAPVGDKLNSLSVGQEVLFCSRIMFSLKNLRILTEKEYLRELFMQRVLEPLVSLRSLMTFQNIAKHPYSVRWESKLL